MQLSQNPINKTLEKQLGQMFYQVLAEIDSLDELKTIFNDVLTDGERIAVLKRLGIALYLDKGRSYEDVKNNIKVSSATIATVAENLGNPGWQEMIKRIKAEEWANEWTDKITGGIKKIFK
ncbi:MAG: TrpR family protein YerC/YecD [Candidatus Collierbacteria bacterium GW2011_GWD2_45_10]|uniref:TrpR family protein YerC/YecD n=1 Tax=Candidatus Collierbacteria bacterium GW2011_GWB2_44_22 TaxID=1618387 RepID=A0A0G1K4H2_9BACT|nr:MAG: TrpR family protein YerC/YecD [Candidatus Collierbacteria bacterium GW2011_GWA2_44_13]KKT51162.1 MAG: TrpR family protein YerC/YecD [Candidatus Collierbacteria bacterium GW2011_GWB2_44_22]KKT61421.1 MAG: TrpR family protein YerC/YecD [Candidatus Collierbacteria bacterium GW2011_GWD1_44_27]KKT64675.1 MAG: TrpR family protein YerC/YecD [Candidatus Collierbacteria bacterium GW2011_GWC2_44_30]KKT88157.1 MAG: TrpR family protein YerC/YecD [Candidatus Collierbacteria bacterium GW2011_GWD2_45_